MDDFSRGEFLMGLDLDILDMDHLELLNTQNLSAELLELTNYIAGIDGPYNSSSQLFADYNSTHGHQFHLSESDQRLQKIIQNLNLYVMPIIIIIGVMGNTISFFVYMCTPALSRQSSSMYLAFLAAVNNGYLASLFFFWLEMVGVNLRNRHVWCQAIQYAQYVFSFLSAWTVVSFTCERWIVVFHPLKRHELCTRRRALVVTGCLTLAALCVYSFSVFTTSIHETHGMSMCLPKLQYHGFLKVFELVDTVNIVILPVLAIVSMNTGIGVRICRYTSRKKAADGSGAVKQACRGSAGHAMDAEMSNISVLKTGGAGDGEESLEFSTRTNGTRTSVLYLTSTTRPRPWRFLTKRHHTQLRITRALLIVSSVFVVLNLPHSVLRIQACIMSMRNLKLKVSPLSRFIWHEFMQLLYYINFSSNFILYSACSRNFRFALKKLLRRAKHKWRSLSNQRSIAFYNAFVKRNEKTENKPN